MLRATGLVVALGAMACGGGEPAVPADAPDGERVPSTIERALDFGETSSDAAPKPLVTGMAPDGVSGEVVFQSDVAGRPAIFRMTLPAGQVTRLTQGDEVRDETPRWSPDGRRILFASNRAYYGPSAAAGAPVLDLHVMNADGTDIRRLTSGAGNDRDGAWFPDGRSVVFWSDDESRGDLYRLWLDDGRIERLTTNFVGRAIMPTVSPDGTKVAFASQTLRVGAFWNYQVQVLDLATGAVTAVGREGGTCWPAWLDNQTLAFVQLEPEPLRIQRQSLAGGAAETIARLDDRWLYYPRVSPDGRWLAVSVSPEHHEGEDWDLALVDLAGDGRVTRITAGPGNDRLPDWRPGAHDAVASTAGVAASLATWIEDAPADREGPADGVVSALASDARAPVVFQSDRAGRDKLYTIDPARGQVRALTHGPDHRDEEPAWSPDGLRLAFHTNRFDPQTYDIAVMNADGTGVRRVTDHRAWDQDPVWMPDGRSLVFTSERSGTGAIYRVWLDDGRVDRLSTTADRAIMPAVSPDGRQVAYAVATASGFQIALLDLATGVERPVTRVDGGACRPAWSPDGRRLAYVRMQGDEPSWLEEVDLASGQTRVLVDARPLWSYYPAYAADGATVLFSVSPEHHAGEDWDLAVTDPTMPTGFRRLTEGAGNDRVPAVQR